MEEGLLGAVIGAFLAGIIQFYVSYSEQKTRAKSLALALKAEIQSLVNIVTHRNYIEIFENSYKTQDPQTLCITLDYFQIFNATCTDIGRLPPEISEKVVGFYSYGKSFIEDVRKFCAEDASIECLQAYPEMIEMLKKAKSSGEEAIQLISNKYAK